MFSMLFFAGQLLAQNRIITGKVTDAQGNAVPNASIRVKGGNIGATTGPDGSYTIPVSANSRTLIISSIGFAEQEVEIGGKTVLPITLNNSNQSMDEVVVVAYGTVKKGENTGSSAQVNASDISKRGTTNALNDLVGSAPGIQTTTASGQPGSSPGIRLRGYTSYSLGNDPLILVDGVVYDGGLSNINPEDIESISTLKDAASGALYGSRGANGIIAITTKKGVKGHSSLTFKAVQGYTERGIPEYSKVNAFQYYPLMWEAYRNNLVYTSAIPIADASNIASGTLTRYTTGANIGKQNYNGVAYSDIYQQLGYNPFNVASTAIVLPNGTLNPAAQLLYADDLDWEAQSTRKGARKEYDVTYSGTGDKSDYYSSLSYTKEKGWSSSADYQRFAGRVSLNTQATKWFKTGFNLSGILINQNTTPTSGIVNPFYFARYIAPIYPVYAHNITTGAYVLDANGNKVYDYGNSPSRPYNTGRHTIQENLLNQNLQKRAAFNARTYGEVSFTRDLKAVTNISLDVQDNYTSSYDNPIVGDGAPSGRAGRTSTRTLSYTWNQLLNYAKRFGNHNIAVVAGHETYDYTYNYLYGFKTVQVVDGITELANFSTVSTLTSYQDQKRIESYLSKVNYDFKGKYLLSGSFRRDGNSKFSRVVRWDNFWSIGGAWRLDKEAFFNVANVDLIKLRSSYGKVGNDQIGNYPYQSFYDLGRNNASEPGFTQGTLGNDSLTWETAKSFDAAVEFGLYKGRINGTVEYFNRVTDGLIFSVPQPLSNGGTTGGALSVYQNIGDLYNRGLEVQLSGDIVRNKNFRWTLTLNGTAFNKNKVTSMPPTRQKIQSGTKQLEVGKSIYDFYLRHYYGVDPADGAALYSNVITYSTTNCRILDNGKGGKDTVTTTPSNANYLYTGTSSIPKLYGGITNAFSYKGFDFSFLLTYQLGGQVYDGVYASLMSSGTYGTALHEDILKRWQKAGDITNVPRMDNARTSDFGAQSDRFLIDASYLSINSINVGYTLPNRILSKLTARGARIYISGENLWFFSKRKGMNVNGNFSGTTGDDYTVARVVSAGINLNF